MDRTTKAAVPAVSSVSRVLLGAGGRTPGVDVLDIRTGTVAKVLKLQEGDSAYRIGRATGGQTAVVGTKRGHLFWIDPTPNADAQNPAAVIKRIQGAPVLAVLLTELNQALVCDSAGRVLLWESSTGHPISIPGGRGAVCALAKFGERLVAGLSASGEMLFWDMAQVRLLKTIAASSPPRWSALVGLVDWKQAQALAYSSPEGDLVLVRPESEEVCRVKAHKGPFYAATICGDNLLTVGFDDAVLRRWNPTSLTIEEELEAPKGVIAATIANSGSPKLVLVCRDGGGVYEFENGELLLCKPLRGCAYRSAVGPSWNEIVEEQEEQQRVEVNGLVAEIRQAASRGQRDDLDDRHGRLRQLGYEHVSLVLHAEHARSQEDLVAELRAYHSLARLVKNQPQSARRSLGRYAELLECFWQLKAATRQYEVLGAWDTNSAARACQLLPLIHALENADALLEPGLSPDVLLDGVAAVSGAFTCHLVTKVFSSRSMAGGTFQPEDIVQKYEQIRRSKPTKIPPARIVHSAPWITHERVETVDVILFADERQEGADPPLFGLKLLDGLPQTTVVPFVAIDGRLPAQASNDDGRTEVWAVLRTQEDRVQGWIKPVQAAVRQTLQRLLTAELAQRR